MLPLRRSENGASPVILGGRSCAPVSGRSIARILLLLATTFIFGCEAPLVMDAVEAQQQSMSRRTDMFQAAADNGRTQVVVGSFGAVVRSTDKGDTWQRQVLPGKPFLIDVAACPDGRFVALDFSHRIWFGDAEGSAWIDQAIATAEVLQAITCDPRNRLWVVGGFSSLLVSEDAGKTWTTTSLGEDLHYTSIQFVDQANGFATGEFGAVARTSDGGNTWEPLAPLPDEFYPQDALFLSPDVGWVVGLNGIVLATRDGGQSWQRQRTGTEAPLYGISRDAKSLWVVGGSGIVLAADYQDNSGELEWRRLDHGKPIRFYLRAVQPVATGRLLVAGGFGALFLLRG